MGVGMGLGVGVSACPMEKALTERYFAVPTRARHSWNSSKSSRPLSDSAVACPAPTSSPRCDT